MGLLQFDQIFRQMGFPVRHPLREPNSSADSLMAATHRELATLNADMMGAQAYLGQFGRGSGAKGPVRGSRRLFRDLIDNAAQPILILDPRPGLHIVDFNDAYAAVSMTERSRVVGDKLFNVFPDNPELPDADGVSSLYESLRTCAQSGRAHRMAVIRYDIQDRAGQFVKRHWQPVKPPIFDARGRLVFLAHHSGEAVEA